MSTEPTNEPEKNQFTGDEGEIIPTKIARKWMDNYEFAENIRGTGEKLIKAHFFGRNKIEEILAVDNAVGIRIYYALNDKGQKQLLLTPVDKDWKDIEVKEGLPIFYDMSRTCPPYCSKWKDIKCTDPFSDSDIDMDRYGQ